MAVLQSPEMYQKGRTSAELPLLLQNKLVYHLYLPGRGNQHIQKQAPLLFWGHLSTENTSHLPLVLGQVELYQYVLEMILVIYPYWS